MQAFLRHGNEHICRYGNPFLRLDGGLGLAYLKLCVIAEELGRVLAPVPFSSTIYLAAELLKSTGTEAQKQEWLPKIASGNAIGTLAAAESAGALSAIGISTVVADGYLSGCKIPVLDGDVAGFAIVLAKDGDTQGPLSFYLVRLDQAGVERKVLNTIDPTRSQSSLAFAQVAAERLGAPGAGWCLFQEALDRAAVLTGFEQIGGADRCLEMAKD